MIKIVLEKPGHGMTLRSSLIPDGHETAEFSTDRGIQAHLLSRLEHIERALLSGSNRAVFLGRVLELESMAFSLRNGGLLLLRQFELIDKTCQTLRKKYQLKAAYRGTFY